MREAPALVLIDKLQKAGCRVKVYDPISMTECKLRIGDIVTYCKDKMCIRDMRWTHHRFNNANQPGTTAATNKFINQCQTFLCGDGYKRQCGGLLAGKE